MLWYTVLYVCSMVYCALCVFRGILCSVCVPLGTVLCVFHGILCSMCVLWYTVLSMCSVRYYALWVFRGILCSVCVPWYIVLYLFSIVYRALFSHKHCICYVWCVSVSWRILFWYHSLNTASKIKNLILHAIHWIKLHGSPLRTGLNSADCWPVWCHLKQSKCRVMSNVIGKIPCTLGSFIQDHTVHAFCYCLSQIRTKIWISPGSECCDCLLHPSFYFYPESGAKIFSTTSIYYLPAYT